MTKALVLSVFLVPTALGVEAATPVWNPLGQTAFPDALGTSQVVPMEAGFLVGRPASQATGVVTLVDPVNVALLDNLTPTATGSGAEFGHRLGFLGQRLIVAEARRQMQPPATSGVVRIYQRTAGAWVESALLSPPQPTLGLRFGDAVALGGDHAFVAAPGFYFDRGLVYIYQRDPAQTPEWRQVGSVLAFDGEIFDAFGSSMTADGDWLFVGAPLQESTAGTESEGSVYVFRRQGSTFGQIQQLEAGQTPQSGAQFGAALASSGRWLIVGAPSEDGQAVGDNQGAAHLFQLVGEEWHWVQRIQASDATPDSGFGSAVSIAGDKVCVSAPLADNEFGTNAGAAYVFERLSSGWTETGRLAPVTNTVRGACAVGTGAIAATIFDASGAAVRYFPATERLFADGLEE